MVIILAKTCMSIWLGWNGIMPFFVFWHWPYKHKHKKQYYSNNNQQSKDTNQHQWEQMVPLCYPLEAPMLNHDTNKAPYHDRIHHKDVAEKAIQNCILKEKIRKHN